MKWISLEQNLFPGFVHFIIKNEWKSVSLTSRLLDPQGNFRQIRSLNSRIFYLKASGLPDIMGVVMITPTGLFLPMLSPKLPSYDTLFRNSTIRFLSSCRKISCIMGTDSDVNAFKNLVNLQTRTEIEYDLMAADLPLEQPFLPRNFLKIKRAEEEDAEKLLPLEEKYMIDEVLLVSSHLKKKAVLKNLRDNCRNQILLYVERDGIPAAKANTNALGINYAQIGGVFTDYTHRRKGFSSILIKQLLFESAKLRKKSILFVKKNNKPAVNLYLKTGFKKIDNYRIVYINF